MKKLIHLSFIFLLITKAYGQCNFKTSDSIQRKELESNWISYKKIFVPADITKFPLVFQRISDKELADKAQHARQKFNQTQKVTDCEEGNYYSSWYEEKWVNKNYKAGKIFVNADSVQYLDPEKFPYVFMFYSMEAYDSDLRIPNGRQGAYIWDRRTDKKYPVINACGKREMIWLLTNLN